ncbi:MAG: hypothetical protein WCH40_04560, partial [Verrucomicrobiales bacterium]
SNFLQFNIDTGANDRLGSDQDVIHIASALVASGLQSMAIRTGAGDDTLSIDKEFNQTPSFGASLVFEAGSGNDTIFGPSADTEWRVTGHNSGTVGSAVNPKISFSGAENLTGGAGGVDNFVISAAGSLSGTVRGQGSDTDSLTVQLQANANAHTLAMVNGAASTAGSVARDGATVASYAEIKQPIGLTVIATSSADTIELAAGAAGTVDIRSTNAIATFGTVNVTLKVGIVLGLDMGAGSDSLTIAASAVDAVLAGGEIEVDGSSGANSITSLAARNTWNINALNQGTLNGVISFTNVQTLTGGSLLDSFIFADGASVSGTVDGADGDNTLDYSAYKTAVAINMGSHAATGTFSATNFDNVVGGSAADTLTGPASDTIWRIDGANTGYLFQAGTTILNFSEMENLTGAATNRDTFVVEKDGSITGTVTGSVASKGGLLVQSDTDDAYTVVNPQAGGGLQTITVHTKTIAFTGLYSFVSLTATPNATIRGGELDSRWRLGDAGTAGQLKVTNLTGRFYDVASVALVDNLSFAKPTTSLTIVLGDAESAIGLDTITGPLAINIQGGIGFSALYARDDAAHIWTITGINTGTVDGYDTTTVQFSGIGTLVGGNQNDTFVFANNVAVVDGIDGGTGGVNTIDYSATTSGVTLQLGINNVNINAVIGGTGIDTLIGVLDDNSWTISGNNSGQVVTNRHSTTALDSSTVVNTTAKTIHFPVAQTFIDGDQVSYLSDLAAAADTSGLTRRTYFVKLIDSKTIQLSLTAGGSAVTLGANPWAVGNSLLSHAAVEIYRVSFSNFENLAGSVGNDAFVLANGAGVTGSIDGGAGSNSIDYSAYTTSVTLNLGSVAAGATTGAGGGVRNMTSVTGGSATDTLKGPELGATWEITGSNVGSIRAVSFDTTGAAATGLVTFSSFENLTGTPNFNDGFVVRAGGHVSGVINGGADRTGTLSIEDPANPGHLAIVKPGAATSGVITAGAIYAGTLAVSFAGIGDPFEADTSVPGIVTLSSNLIGGQLSLTQDGSGNIVLTNTSASTVFWDYGTSTFVSANSLATSLPGGTNRLELVGGGTVTIGNLTIPGTDFVVTNSGDYVFVGNVLTGGGSITVIPPELRKNETVSNTSSTITVNAGVVLNTRKTAGAGILTGSGISTATSGNITLKANTITINNNAQLLSYDDRATASTAGVPLGIHNQSSPANPWLPGKIYRDIPTTTTDNGAGLRVDVVVDNDGNPTVILRTPGTGYVDNQLITIKHPNAFLTGTTSFHNGSDLTVQVNGIQGLGGSISLSAYHHAQAIAWSYNPIDVSITDGSGVLIKGRDVSVIADADNTWLFDGSKDPIGTTSGEFVSSSDTFNRFAQNSSEALFDFLFNFRLLVGVSKSEASATVTLSAGSSIEAMGGNVFTEAFARSKAQAFTVGLTIGFTYARSDATAKVDALGSITATTGNVSIIATTANTIDATTKTTSAGALKRYNPYS